MGTRILTQLLMPPASLLGLVLLGLLLRRLGRRRLAAGCFVVSVLALWALSTPRIADALVAGLERTYLPARPADLPQADAIVLLGGALGAPLPPRLAPDLSEGADRVLHAARLFRAGRAPLLVASGGNPPHLGAEAPEGADMADLLVEWGVPREAIVTEGASLDTHENAVETARLLETRGARRILLVTSALHMPRAAAAFRQTGLEVVPAPTDYQAVDAREATLLDWLPDADALERSRNALKEHLGRLWYRLRGWGD
jgi:uncharacterized SAM-binding protein YcdF (DUF218 family)